MREQRELPLIKIGDVDFIIDVAFAELRQKDSPGNRISFADLEVEGIKYVLYHDPVSKAVYFDEGQGLEKSAIEQMVRLDPEGVCIRHGLSRDQLPDQDSKLKSDPLLLRQRIDMGMLPRVGIAGQDYFVDVRMEELRSVDAHWKSIDLNLLDVSQFDNYVFFYDDVKHEVVRIEGSSITKEPENAVLVELPNEIWLDPVGVGRKYSGNDLEFVDMFPLQHNLQARIYPLSQTDLPKIIAENQKRMASQEETPKISKPNKKGNRI